MARRKLEDKNIKKIIKEINISKEKFISALISVIILIFLIIDSNLFNFQVTSIFIASFLFLLIMVFMIMAGMFVVRALFKASVGLSLLIFLSQSYCMLPNSARTGQEALKSLLAIGFLYIVYDFTRELIESFKKIKLFKKGGRKIFFVALFLFFIIYFIFTIYQVIKPIIVNLCIY